MADEFSVLLNHSLDTIGYSTKNIALRSKLFKAATKICSERCTEPFGLEILPAGSKAEGVSLSCASDQDIMAVFREYVCVDYGHVENGIFVIKRFFDDSPPGYIKIAPLDGEIGRITFLHLFSVYIPNKDIVLLSSIGCRGFISLMHGYIMPIQGVEMKASTVSGPALALTINRTMMAEVFSADLYADMVFAIPYHSSFLLEQWRDRERLYDWPSVETIKDVSTTEGYVVPVGHKGSEEQNFEWRVCYTTGEQKLLGSLNEIQIKLYVLLKMINTCIIKDDVDCVSSYMIKNVVMWVAEMCRSGVFKPQNLTRLVLQSLAFLRHCLLYSNFLPNYMISERNLLLGRVEGREKLKLGSIINELLNDGENIFLRCDKLRNAMFVTYENPALAARFSVWRNEVEELLLLMSVKLFSKVKPDMVHQPTFFYDLFFEYLKDDSFVDTTARLINLLCLDVRALCSNDFQDLNGIDSWINNLLS